MKVISSGKNATPDAASESGARLIHSFFPFIGNTDPTTFSAILAEETTPEDILFDAIGWDPTLVIEALLLRRRVVVRPASPFSSFVLNAILQPVSLPRLQWAFQDVAADCRMDIASQFKTRCAVCKGTGELIYLQWEGGKPVQAAYRCRCSSGRLYKKPSGADIAAARKTFVGPANRSAPASVDISSSGCPGSTPLPMIYNARVIDSLSGIHQAIRKIDGSPRDVLLLAFAACLEPCSRMRIRNIQSRAGTTPALAPRMRWKEWNPWLLFEENFRLAYEGKQAGNTLLQDIRQAAGMPEWMTGAANLLILDHAGPPPAADSVNCAIIHLDGRLPPERMLTEALWEVWTAGEDNMHSPTPAPDIDLIRQALRADGRMYAFAPMESIPALRESLQRFFAAGFTLAAARQAAEGMPTPGAAQSWLLLRGEKSNRLPPADKSRSASTLRRKLVDTAKTRLALSPSGISLTELAAATLPRLDADELAAFAGSASPEWITKVLVKAAVFRGRKLLPRPGAKLTPIRRRKLARILQTVLDVDSTAGDADTSAMLWRAAGRRLGAEGIVPQDLASIRRRIPADRILSHRQARYSCLLKNLGRLLGYRVQSTAGGNPRVTWRRAGAPELGFLLRRKDVVIQSRSRGAAVVSWGSLSYLDLEEAIRAWCGNHPDQSAKLAAGLLPADGMNPESSAWMTLRATTSPISDLRLKVVSNQAVCKDHHLLTLAIPRGTQLDFLPGQFFQTVCDPEIPAGGSLPLTLRRPFSIHAARYADFPRSALAHAEILPLEIRRALVRRPAQIDFLYRVVGEGTRALTRVRKGESLAALGPLGNGFRIGEERTAVIIAGGIGVAPLIALAERLRFLGKDVLIYMGAVRREMLRLAAPGSDGDDAELDAVLRREFSAIGAQVLSVCTDDGSAGEKGFVTEMFAQGIRGGCVPRTDIQLYACGPVGMLKAVAAIAETNDLPCQVSLEERMACGIGACYACTCNTAGPDGAIRKLRVCREGPVFDAKEIRWKD